MFSHEIGDRHSNEGKFCSSQEQSMRKVSKAYHCTFLIKFTNTMHSLGSDIFVLMKDNLSLDTALIKCQLT